MQGLIARELSRVVQCLMLSVGLGLFIAYFEPDDLWTFNFWMRSVGFALIVLALDWRYAYGRSK